MVAVPCSSKSAWPGDATAEAKDVDVERVLGALQLMGVGVVVLEARGRIVAGNRRFWELLPDSSGAGAQVGAVDFDLLEDLVIDPQAFPTAREREADLAHVLDGSVAHCRRHFKVSAPDGDKRFVVDMAHLPGGGAVVAHLDVTELFQQRAAIEWQAFHDGLTGLLTHQAFHREAERALAVAQRHERRMHVLMMDVDRFKRINDRHGHAFGDRVLVSIAQRLRASLRNADHIGRLGGDEFAILIDGEDSPTDIRGRLRATLAEPVELGRAVVRPECSIGVATYPDDAFTIHALLQLADLRMYSEKRRNDPRAAT